MTYNEDDKKVYQTDLICKSDVLETYAELYNIFDDNKNIQKEFDKVFDKLNDIPAVEPKTGEWIEHKARTIVRDNNFIDFFPTEHECSNCGLRQATYFINSTLPNFCPHCGARMKGTNDDSKV